MRGGYKILDLKNVNFTPDSGQVVPGSYELLEGSPKATLVSGLVIEGTEIPETFAPCTLSQGVYTLTVPGYTVKVESSDTVTISASAEARIASKFNTAVVKTATKK